ncbi:UDP-N-acetylmuramoyl-L-alanine--D-glutamate ligase [Oligella ureolytica]
MGLASALWCLREGAKLRVADTRQEPPGLAEIQEAAAVKPTVEVSYALGGDCLDVRTLEGVDLAGMTVMLSP